jgi:hypothetical protein
MQLGVADRFVGHVNAEYGSGTGGGDQMGAVTHTTGRVEDSFAGIRFLEKAIALEVFFREDIPRFHTGRDPFDRFHKGFALLYRAKKAVFGILFGK